MPDVKHLAALIVGKPQDEPDGDEGDGGNASKAELLAAEELIAALKGYDGPPKPSEVARALRVAVRAVQDA